MTLALAAAQEEEKCSSLAQPKLLNPWVYRALTL